MQLILSRGAAADVYLRSDIDPVCSLFPLVNWVGVSLEVAR